MGGRVSRWSAAASPLPLSIEMGGVFRSGGSVENMATPGKPLDESTKKIIQRMTEHGTPRRIVAKETDTCKRTVDKYAANKEREKAK